MTGLEDSKTLRIREILGGSLMAGEIAPAGSSRHILHLTHESIDVMVKIPGLSEIGWTALMFESAAALEECCGGPCKLNIVEELGSEDWTWEIVNTTQIGILGGVKLAADFESVVGVKIVGEFALNGDGVEVVEYYLCIDNRRYQALVTCEGEYLRISAGSETFADVKMRFNLGDLALTTKQARRLVSGAILRIPRPREHNVLLSVGGSRYAVGEASWSDSGLRLTLAAKF